VWSGRAVLAWAISLSLVLFFLAALGVVAVLFDACEETIGTSPKLCDDEGPPPLWTAVAFVPPISVAITSWVGWRRRDTRWFFLGVGLAVITTWVIWDLPMFFPEEGE
jgi:hypothetical protein